MRRPPLTGVLGEDSSHSTPWIGSSGSPWGKGCFSKKVLNSGNLVFESCERSNVYPRKQAGGSCRVRTPALLQARGGRRLVLRSSKAKSSFFAQSLENWVGCKQRPHICHQPMVPLASLLLLWYSY